MSEAKKSPALPVADKNAVPEGSGFCQQMGKHFEKMLVEADDDPRLLYGRESKKGLERGRKVYQAADAREPGGLTPD